MGAEGLPRPVLLAGATGYIGSRLAVELLDAGYHLVCPVRDAAAPAARSLRRSGTPQQLRLLEADPTDQESLETALKGASADAIISCLASRSGGPADSEAVDHRANHYLLDWGLKHDVSHFTLLSAICVQKPRLAFQHAKRRFESELAASGLSFSIVRPTAFFKSLSGQVARVRAGKPFLLFGNGELTRCKPIAEGDLARYLRLTLEEPSLRGIRPIGGPGPAITPLEQARLLARVCGKTLRTRSVNPGLLLAVARFLDLAARIRPGLADKAEFARIGHYYATESMLLWDEDAGRYDADATPEFGEITLEESYRAQIAGKEAQSLGTHAVFD